MGLPRRLKRETGLHALVDGIPFGMPIGAEHTPALMAAFSIDARKAAALLPGGEVRPIQLGGRGLLVVTVVNYIDTVIGKYIEFSVAIACRRGLSVGQYVYDLPVSTEISVKGGKGIWGMPKHQANLDFQIAERTVSSQYDLDGQLAVRIEIEKPKSTWLPLNSKATNYCEFRGMLFKSDIYFIGSFGFSLFKRGAARLCLGDHPRVAPLKELDVRPDPIFTAFFPQIHGALDDHVESWFVLYPEPPTERPEGLESVVDLGLSQAWLTAPEPADDCPPAGVKVSRPEPEAVAAQR